MTFLLEHPVLSTVLFVVYCICVSAFWYWFASGGDGAEIKKRVYDNGYLSCTLPVLCCFAFCLWARGLTAATAAPAGSSTSSPILIAPSGSGQPAAVQLKDGHFVTVDH